MSQTFTFHNKTFTTEEELLYGARIVTIVGALQYGGMGEIDGVVFRSESGNYDFATSSELFRPIPEPTIEVPVIVLKALLRPVSGELGDWDEAARSTRNLIEEAGH